MKDKYNSYEKFLALILRHKPEAIDIKVDFNGWAFIDDIIKNASKKGYNYTNDIINEIVTNSDKKRFSISDDKLKIRANQGHSIQVDVNLLISQPPKLLYHGTDANNYDSIKVSGIKSMSRLHVHLSTSIKTALKVARRHGNTPLVLSIDTLKMFNDGYEFYLSENNVWLTNHVPAKYIK